MSEDDCTMVKKEFVEAVDRSLAAGFKIVEIHMAHGYLLHEFLSPLTNKRQDKYGGSFENRVRFPIEVAKAMRARWPKDLPLFVRISAVDWVDGGWTIEDSVKFSKILQEENIDLIDCSSGAAVPQAKIPIGPGYQVPFAERIRAEANILTAAVGLITEPQQAETILTNGQADAIFLARALLRDPYWPARAAKALGANVPWPKQYGRAEVT